MTRGFAQMTIHNNTLNKRTRWSDCNQVAELTLLIDAMPPSHRGEIVRAAVKFEPISELGAGYIVGEIRSLVVDGVAQLFGHSVSSKFQTLAQCLDLDQLLSDFAYCGDPAAVQLVVCDLMEWIALTVRASE